MTMVELASPMITFPDTGSFRGAVAQDAAADSAPAESVEYFLSRERAERSAAKNAASLSARRVHQELAQNYAGVAKRLQQKAAA